MVATTSIEKPTVVQQNPLYPIFLKLHQLQLLIVGAGEVGCEKLSFILKSSPEAQITVVAPYISPAVETLAANRDNVRIIRRKFEANDLINKDLVIAATNIRSLNQEIQQEAKRKKVLINVADTPDLCDFYLGAIVTRGNLKVAISTNGQSPTFAKRFRQLLEKVIPTDTHDLLDHLKQIRDRLTGNFEDKVKKLNVLTAELLNEGMNE